MPGPQHAVYLRSTRRKRHAGEFTDIAIAAPGARGQSAPLNPANAKSFLGVWVIEMTEPAAFKGHTR